MKWVFILTNGRSRPASKCLICQTVIAVRETDKVRKSRGRTEGKTGVTVDKRAQSLYCTLSRLEIQVDFVLKENNWNLRRQRQPF